MKYISTGLEHPKKPKK